MFGLNDSRVRRVRHATVEWVRRQARDHPSRLATGGAVALTAVVVLGSLLAGVGTGTPTTSPGPTGSTSHSTEPSQPSAWQPLDLPPYQATAELIPFTIDGAGIDPAGPFTLRSLDGTPAVDLAEGLQAQPAVEFAVEAGPSTDAAIVRPIEPLLTATRYRFELIAPDGSLAERWAFRTTGPLHVVGLLPDDHTTQVPVDTGIEMEFDHDSVVNVPEHFSIEPDVRGRFEQHGRTWVFLPAAPLRSSTLYHVTLGAGVRIAGSDQTLENDVQLRFETAGAESQRDQPLAYFERPILDVAPDASPVIPLGYYYYEPDAGTVTTTTAVQVYRLGDVDRATEAVNELTVDLSWATWSSTGNVSTEALELVATMEATVTGDFQGRSMRLPTGLAAGWYLLEVIQEGRHAQVVLQVSNLAAYALASATDTVIWVNDLETDEPIGDASVSIWNGESLGRTEGNGLLTAKTPATLQSVLDAGNPTALIVSAPDGRRLIAPLLGEPGSWYREVGAPWWLLFGTDRLQYRRSDTIHAWGLVRSRAGGEVPQDVELRLVAGQDGSGPPIVRLRVEPTRRGSFIADLPIRELPLGEYRATLLVDGTVVGQASIIVADIRKPVFRIGLTTDRRVYVDGEQVSAAVAADFYDGSPAPGVRLRVDGSAGGTEVSRELQTGGGGEASLTVEAAANDAMPSSGYLSATPALPEEGSSEGHVNFVVLPATVWLAADASLVDGQLTIGGRLAGVDRAAAEQQVLEDGWVSDPSGDAISGGRVSIRVNRITWKATQTGTTYDFLLKKVVPLYRYDQVTTAIGSFSVSSGADGTFELVQPVGVLNAGYEVHASATDAEGRRHDTTAWAMQTQAFSTPSNFPYLQTFAPCGHGATESVGIDDDIELTVFNGDGTPLVDGRTLFVTGRLGIAGASVTGEASFSHRFARDDLPSLAVRAVTFTPAGYVVTNDYQLRVLEAETAVRVELTPDQDRYQPGDTVRVGIRTTGPDGRRIPADVIVRAVDMKLYAVGAAEDMDVGRLMQPVAAGFLASYASHRVQAPAGYDGCGGGATTGGGDYREDFADLATFQLVQTDANGIGSASFELPDDLTSWGVSATALTDGLEAGTGAIEIPAGLSFFVDATIAPEYLADEEPIIQLRAFGEGLAEGDRVRFTVAAPDLALPATTVEGSAFEYVGVPLPALSLGDHRVTIDAEKVGADPKLVDRVARTVHVVTTRLGAMMTETLPLVDGMSLPGGDGLTTIVISDAGRGSLVGILQSLAWGANARFDTSLAADVARRILVDEFGFPESSLPPSDLDLNRAGFEGLALLPYASPSLYLTARCALVAPDHIMTDQLRYALRDWAVDPSATRERRIVALAGLAGLGDDVLGELRELDVAGLSLQERLWLSLGLAAGGDEDRARDIERTVLADYGQRLDRWVRLDGDGDADEDRAATINLLLLAAQLRDPMASDISRYLVANPSNEASDALEQLGYARSAMAWLPRPEARFAWTADGDRHVESLERGRDVTLVLTADQRETLALERIEGQLAVSASWIGEARYDGLPSHESISIERIVEPAADAPADGRVHVRLNVAFAPGVPAGCYQVTDVLPSGLAPVIAPWNGYEDWGRNYLAPYEVEGQRVSWCIDPRSQRLPLGYAARVVTPGTYRWEPAVVQSVSAPSIGASTPVSTYTIR